MITHTLDHNIVVHEYPERVFIIKNLISQPFCAKMVDIMKQVNFNNRIQYKEGNNVLGEEISLHQLRTLCNSQLKQTDKATLNDLIVIFYSLYIRSMVYVMQTINSHIFNNNIPRISGVCVRKIDGPTRTHADGPVSDGGIRLLTCIIALNSDYKDGKFYFPKQNIDLKLEAGDILLFPPYWTHPHYTDNPVENVRYTLTFWFHTMDSNGISVI
jgi:hypothetical protein